MDCEIAYYEYYDYQISDHVDFVSESGNSYYCVYHIYTPKDAELDETTPVVAYVTHGGGDVGEERAIALDGAANNDTGAIFIMPNTDRADAVCAALEDARQRFDGKGNFDEVSIHGTSSGGRAIIMAALESVGPGADYGFRFANVIAYDPAQETDTVNITGQTERMKLLAEQGTVLFIQTDMDLTGHHGGSGRHCNALAKVYSELGGTAIIAQLHAGDHEAKFIKPLRHNSVNWSVGKEPLTEDESYQNDWFYYKDGEKIPITLAEATKLLHPEQKEMPTPGCPVTRPPWIGWPAPYRPYPHYVTPEMVYTQNPPT